MKSDRVAAVVLAAGLSSRMGKNKLLIRLQGESMVHRAVARAIAAELDPVVVVVGHEDQLVRAELAGLSHTEVRNPEYARGMNTSLRTGIAALPAEAEAAVVLLADMPFVEVSMLRELVAAFARGTSPLVLSSYGGVVAPPILYRRALFDELRALEGEACGKRVIEAHRAEAAELRWPAAALLDLDLPEDLERVRTALEAPAPPSAIDPVCGMTVEVSAARFRALHDEVEFLFCNPRCREKFLADPGRFLALQEQPRWLSRS